MEPNVRHVIRNGKHMKPDGTPLTQLTCWLEPELAEAFKQIARKQDRAYGAQLRRLVRQFVESEGETAA